MLKRNISNDNLSADLLNNLFNDGKELNKEQIQGINNAINNSLSIITGGGGTGKTSIPKYLIKYEKNLNSELQKVSLFTTPTHAAKKRGMKDLKGLEMHVDFSVIHSLIYKYRMDYKLQCENIGFDRYRYEHNIQDDYDMEYYYTTKLDQILSLGNVKYIFVDEMSMVDLDLFSNLLDILVYYEDIRLILLGDNKQLEPVGAGCPFRDLLRLNIKKSELIINYRSNKDIKGFCYDYLNDDYVSVCKDHQFSLQDKYNENIHYYLNVDKRKTIENILKRFKQNRYEPYCLNPEHDNNFQLITKKNSDCEIFSKIVRKVFIGDESNDNFIIGDPVIIKKNDKELNIFNGDEGIITEIVNGEYNIKLHEGGEVSLLPEDFKPSFCRTIHSSQGLQYNKVVYIGSNYSNIKLNYTGYSRSKDDLYLVGKDENFNEKRNPVFRNTFINLHIDGKIDLFQKE